MSVKTNLAQADLPTVFGNLKVLVWPGEKGNEPVALTTPNLDVKKPVLVRIHSECLTGDVFGSMLCDCGDQAKLALKTVAESGNGIFIYHRQEGRGIGLFEKIRAYAIQQEEQLDTYEANIKLGHKADLRDYTDSVRILKTLSVKQITLLTNNPHKTQELQKAGFTVEQKQLVIESNQYNQKYLEAKRNRFKQWPLHSDED